MIGSSHVIDIIVKKASTFGITLLFDYLCDNNGDQDILKHMGVLKFFVLFFISVLYIWVLAAIGINVPRIRDYIRNLEKKIIQRFYSESTHGTDRSAHNTYESTHKTSESTGTENTSSYHTYKSTNPKYQRRIVFDMRADVDESGKQTLYAAVLSVIALFSWVMRKDGSAGKQELEVARIYFRKHPLFTGVLSSPPQDQVNDPVTNTPIISSNDCMKLLRSYNKLPRLLKYSKCCDNIMAANIYPSAALDLLRILFQVAYSSDGVIESEMEILHGIAQELKIRPEDWNNLVRMYGTYREPNRGKKSTNQSANEKSKKSNKKKKRKNRQNEDESGGASDQNEEQWSDEQEQHQKSSTFGYKLTQAYNELGLLTTATEAEIKEAFRALAKKYHPDRLPPEATDQERKISADQFRLVKEAYDLIRLERGS